MLKIGVEYQRNGVQSVIEMAYNAMAAGWRKCLAAGWRLFQLSAIESWRNG